MAARNGIACHLCIQDEHNRFANEKGNALVDRLSGAEYETILPQDTAQAMDDAMERFANKGLKPYYIHGGGHDLPGGRSDVQVVGISVARQHERGKQVIADFANLLAAHYNLNIDFSERVIFNTDYLQGGYEQFNQEMQAFLIDAMKQTGLLFDTTYSGKAFYGMMDYIKKNNLQDKNIIFWHTGGIMNLMA